MRAKLLFESTVDPPVEKSTVYRVGQWARKTVKAFCGLIARPMHDFWIFSMSLSPQEMCWNPHIDNLRKIKEKLGVNIVQVGETAEKEKG